MALTAQEKQRVLNMLDQMDSQSARRVIANEQSFANWLKSKLNAIYQKIQNSIRAIWNWLRQIF
jgi:hypothetical protein